MNNDIIMKNSSQISTQLIQLECFNNLAFIGMCMCILYSICMNAYLCVYIYVFVYLHSYINIFVLSSK